MTSELDKVDGKSDKEINAKRHRKLMQLIEAPDAVRFRSLRNPAGKPQSKK